MLSMLQGIYGVATSTVIKLHEYGLVTTPAAQTKGHVSDGLLFAHSVSHMDVVLKCFAVENHFQEHW